MLEITKQLCDDFYNNKISSQKLIAHITNYEKVDNKLIYDEYNNIEGHQYCTICSSEIFYTGFKNGYICCKKCETQKYVNSLSDEAIKQIILSNFNKHKGFTKSFGLEFKKFEKRLSKLYFNTLGQELKYCAVYNITNKSKCEICGDDCHFSLTKNSYAKGCNINHIMSLENHKWEQHSKDKMIISLKKTRNKKIDENPNYFREIGLKVSLSLSNKSATEKDIINTKRIETNILKYGVENVSQNNDIKEKKKETLFKNYGVSSIWALPEFIRKIKDTNILNGRWLSDLDKPFAQLYYEQVWRNTRNQELDMLDNFNKRGRLDLNPDAYHLDHKFSIKEGFKMNLLPYYVGHINNLEMLPGRLNCSKGSKCSITIDELIKPI